MIESTLEGFGWISYIGVKTADYLVCKSFPGKLINVYPN